MKKEKSGLLEIPNIGTFNTRCDLEIFKEVGLATVVVVSERYDNQGTKVSDNIGRVITDIAKLADAAPDKLDIFVRASERDITPIRFSNGGNSTSQGGSTLWLQHSDGKSITKEDLDAKISPASLGPMRTLTLELEENTPLFPSLEATAPEAILEAVALPTIDWLEMAERNDPIAALMYKAEVAKENVATESLKATSLTASGTTEKTAPPPAVDDDFGQNY